MSQAPKRRKVAPKALRAKTDREMMAAIFGERVMKEVDKVVEPRRCEDSKNMNA